MPDQLSREEVHRNLKTKLRRLEKLADNTVLKQYELAHEQDTLDSCQGFVEESTSDLITATFPSLAEGNLDARLQRVEEIHDRLRADFDTLKTQTARVKLIRGTIGLLESRLKDRVEKLGRLLDDGSSPTAHRGSETADSDLEANTSSAASSVHSLMPPLLAEYYDRKGDIGIFRERLQELDDSHQESLAGFDLVAERGDEPKIPVAQHKTEYEAQRQAIMSDLEKAEIDTAALSKQCETAGLQVVDRRQMSSSDSQSSIAPSRNRQRNTLTHGIPYPAEDAGHGLPAMLPHQQTSIRRWLDAVGEPAQLLSPQWNNDGSHAQEPARSVPPKPRLRRSHTNTAVSALERARRNADTTVNDRQDAVGHELRRRWSVPLLEYQKSFVADPIALLEQPPRHIRDVVTAKSDVVETSTRNGQHVTDSSGARSIVTPATSYLSWLPGYSIISKRYNTGHF